MINNILVDFMQYRKISIISNHTKFSENLENKIQKSIKDVEISKFSWNSFEEKYLSYSDLPKGVIIANLFENFNDSFSDFFNILQIEKTKITNHQNESFPPLNFIRSYAFIKKSYDQEHYYKLPKVMFLSINDISNKYLSFYINSINNHLLTLPFTINKLIKDLEKSQILSFTENVCEDGKRFLIRALKPHGQTDEQDNESIIKYYRSFIILLADDHLGRSDISKALQEVINSSKIIQNSKIEFKILGETDAGRTLDRYKKEPYDLIILDKQFTNQTIQGDEILAEIRKFDLVQPILILTGKHQNHIEMSSRYGTNYNASYFEKSRLVTAEGTLNFEALEVFIKLILEQLNKIINPSSLIEFANGFEVYNDLFSYNIMSWWILQTVKDYFVSKSNYSYIFIKPQESYKLTDEYNAYKKFLIRLKEVINKSLISESNQNNIIMGFGDSNNSSFLLIVPNHSKKNILDLFLNESKNNHLLEIKDYILSIVVIPDDLPYQLRRNASSIVDLTLLEICQFIKKMGAIFHTKSDLGINEFFYY